MKHENQFYQEIIVANPKDLRKQLKLKFLVDTGSSGSAVPEKVARALGLECVGEGQVVLADGSRQRTKIAYMYMRVDDEHVFTLVAYNGCDTPLLGFDVMALLGLQVDPQKRRLLKPLRRFSFTNLLFGRKWVGAKRK